MREMNADTFWELIAEAKKECGQDMDASVGWLKDRLMERGPQQAQDFHDILHGYQDLAYQYGLWSAASILCDGCTDDGFMDFRAWLIAQGKEVYLAALKDPDSLADVEAYGGCQFERLSYVGHYALKALTGQSPYDNMNPADCDRLEAELGKEIVYGEGISYPYELNELEVYFPRLCAKCMDPEELAFCAAAQDTVWNGNAPDIQKAREGGPPLKNAAQEHKMTENMMGGIT